MSGLGPGQLLFAFVRHWSRRAAAGSATAAERGRLVLVTEAVGSLAVRGESATVNSIARELAIDQSGASRLIKDAIDTGYLAMERGAADARRREVSVTAAGIAVLEQAHTWQEEMFASLTAGWSQSRRDDFQRAMSDLLARSSEISV